MGKTFYTEHDIEDMARRGERSIVVGEDVVLTDLAYEKAKRLGIQLVDPVEKPPAAPVRPYLNISPQTVNKNKPNLQSENQLAAIKARVKQAVMLKLGAQIDETLLDTIIDRVAQQLGIH